MSAWGMLKQGNILGAIERVWSTLMNDLPAPVAAFVQKILNDEEGALMSAAEVGAQDVLTGGLTTAAFTKAADDMVATLAAKGVTVATTDAFAALNIAVTALQAKAAS